MVSKLDLIIEANSVGLDRGRMFCLPLRSDYGNLLTPLALICRRCTSFHVSSIISSILVSVLALF